MKTKIVNMRSKIKQEFLNGASYSSIARKHNVTSSTICQIAREMGIKKNFSANIKLKWDANAIDKFLVNRKSTIRRNSVVIHNCKVPMEWKCTLCGNIWEQSFDSLTRKKKLNGCPSCDSSEYKQYSVYHDLLETMSPYSAYFLGAFSARGLIKKQIKRSAIIFTNQSKDKLLKLSQIISSTYPIKKLQDGYETKIYSQKMVNKLKKYNKFMIDDIPSQYKHDFVRGYFDFKGYVEYNIESLTKNRLQIIPLRVNLHDKIEVLSKIQKAYINLAPKKYKSSGKGYMQTRKQNKRTVSALHFAGPRTCFNFLSWLYNTNVDTLRYVDANKYNSYIFIKNYLEHKREQKDLILKGKQNED